MNDDVYRVAKTSRSLKLTSSQPSQISGLYIQWETPSQGTRSRVTEQDTWHPLLASIQVQASMDTTNTHIHTYPTPVQTHTPYTHKQKTERRERQEYFASHSKTKTVTDSLNHSQKVFKKVEKVLDLKAKNSPLTTLQREPPTPLSLVSSGSNPKI